MATLGQEARDEALDKLYRSLTNITPTLDQVESIEALRESAKLLGAGIIAWCPPSRECSLAITHLEETVMWAVKSLLVN